MRGADTEFVGHPLVDIVKPHLSKEAAWKKAGKNADRDLILLLPGSRLMEIQKMLPTMLQAAKINFEKNVPIQILLCRGPKQFL